MDRESRITRFAASAATGAWCMKSRVVEFLSRSPGLFKDPLVSGYIAGSSLPSKELVARLCQLGHNAGNPTYADESFWNETIATDVADGRPEIPALVMFEVIQSEQWEAPSTLLLTSSPDLAKAVEAAYNADGEREADGRFAYVRTELLWGEP